MIDIREEKVVSLSDAAKIFPRRRAGKALHVSTLYRWAQRGCRGVRLETCQIGCTKCTSVEAIQRFIVRLSGYQVDVEAMRSAVAGKGKRHIERELDRLGL